MHRYKQPEKTSNYFLHSRKVWELFRMTGGYVESGDDDDDNDDNDDRDV